MLTVMCPNCRHRFPAPGCCNADPKIDNLTMQSLESSGGNYYNCGGGLLVPRGYNTGGGCFINAPTIIHGPAIIQSHSDKSPCDNLQKWDKPLEIFDTDQLLKSQQKNLLNTHSNLHANSECQYNTMCEHLTGGTVTITTPSIQSGGFLIHSQDSTNFLQAPKIEIRPKLSGGGCLLQKKLQLTDDCQSNHVILSNSDCILDPTKSFLSNLKAFEFCQPITKEKLEPPSGCQELPGTRRQGDASNAKTANCSFTNEKSGCCCTRSNSNQTNFSANSNSSCQTPSVCTQETDGRKDDSGVKIQVNATIQLPPNVGQCTVNITAMTNSNTADGVNETVRCKNNFNGGGLVQVVDNNDGGGSNPGSVSVGENERRDDTPTTPVSWLMPFPWGFESYPHDKDLIKLTEIKRLLQTSGWYHEGLSWQQSENLLKNVPIGRWLMRDSSDSRYTFAISVQTNRGPTSVRVHYIFGQFRLDSEPRLVLAMPLFKCPIKMLQYYVEYSRAGENRREVWVDYSGQLYSQIYLTKPFIKQVRSLSHLARLAVNKHKLNTDHLPTPIKNYLAEYPYTF